MTNPYRTDPSLSIRNAYEAMSEEEKNALRAVRSYLPSLGRLEEKLQQQGLTLRDQEVIKELRSLCLEQRALTIFHEDEGLLENIREKIKDNLYLLQVQLPEIKTGFTIHTAFPLPVTIRKIPHLEVFYKDSNLRFPNLEECHTFKVRFRECGLFNKRLELQAQGCYHYTKRSYQPFDRVFDALKKEYIKAVGDRRQTCVEWINSLFTLYTILPESISQLLTTHSLKDALGQLANLPRRA